MKNFHNQAVINHHPHQPPWEHPIKCALETHLAQHPNYTPEQADAARQAFNDGAKAGIAWREGKLPL